MFNKLQEIIFNAMYNQRLHGNTSDGPDGLKLKRNVGRQETMGRQDYIHFT